MHRRNTRALHLLLVALTVLGAAPANAFTLGIHEGIVRDALTKVMEQGALQSVISANLSSDLHQLSPERHFDNAANPSDICDRWDKGLRQFLQQAVDASAPKGPEKRELTDRQGALNAFGLATHAVEDFYSHTNWLELNLGQGTLGTAPLLGSQCDPAAFPGELQSGYFSVTSPPDGCPGTGIFGTGTPQPPPPFKYCHAQLNKDDPNTSEGAKQAPDGTTYHVLARRLATTATADAWQALHERIVSKYGADQSTDAECLFMNLAWGGSTTCQRRWRVKATWRSEASFEPGSEYLQTVDGPEAHLTWVPTRYPGPEAPAVYAPVQGQWTTDTATLVWLHSCEDPGVQRTGHATDLGLAGSLGLTGSGDVHGQFRVTPEPTPVEIFELLQVAIPEFWTPCIGYAATTVGVGSQVDDDYDTVAGFRQLDLHAGPVESTSSGLTTDVDGTHPVDWGFYTDDWILDLEPEPGPDAPVVANTSNRVGQARTMSIRPTTSLRPSAARQSAAHPSDRVRIGTGRHYIDLFRLATAPFAHRRK
ncbi:MAG: hypothetical protein JOY61_06780 [Chloroflexi bacterium]|nr:hypothetical protein [Chloroflexota bacterium]